LRTSIGWRILPSDKIKLGLEYSTCCVCAEDNGKLVGFGRIVGDGATVFYIQDVMVLPSYQKHKIGTQIMEHIMEYIQDNCTQGSIVGLIAISELDGFYQKFGFAYNERNRFYRYN
jgi:GNAT superfamily N-acetyltransferase